MQKKLIVLALAAISAAPAFAQSNVTVYGRVDYGFVTTSGSDGGVQNVNGKQEFASGIQAGSRIGFRGNEDLGNGLKAIFEVESGLSNDANGNAGVWSGLNRHSYVGLTGNFGTVVGGRLDGVRYGIFNKYDAFAGGTVGNFTQMTSQVDRADNAIAYISPNFSGFTVTLAYASNFAGQEAAGNSNDGRLNTIMGNYENGPISLTADYEQIKAVDASNTLALPDYKVKVYTLAGSYDFGVVKVAALWDRHEQDNRNIAGKVVDYRDYFLTASMPFYGKFVAKATYGRVNDNVSRLDAAGNPTDGDSSKWGIGLTYALSKRTQLYTDYGSVSNDNGATQRVHFAANANSMYGGTGSTAAANTAAGRGVNGFDLGIAHTF